jgi:hypothetical protein
MQGWIVRHKREKDLFVNVREKGFVFLWTRPFVFWDEDAAHRANEMVESSDWKVVKVVITEKE